MVSIYFGEDSNALKSFLYTVNKIVSFTNEIQRDFAKTAFYHVNGEQIVRGQENVTVLEIANTTEKTCANCPENSGKYSCTNNIITTKLTSGYRSNQDIHKPTEPLGATVGKCSHGTSDDNSRHTPATGGIYKGRVFSNGAPHHHLHTQALEAATRATHHFLMNKNTGLINILGPQLFKEVLHIKSKKEVVKTSLAFVIDVTGSMKNDIEQVKEGTIKLVEESKNSIYVPEKYILVTFSDPENLTTAQETKNWNEMITMLDNLTVYGGKDCPEYAMSGILTAINMSNPGSKIIVCTDADPKDTWRKNEVIEGQKRSTGYQLFEEIASETGGKVYRTKTSQLEVLVESVVKATLPSSLVNINWFIWAKSDPTNVTLDVDNSIRSLIIYISGPLSSSDVALRDSTDKLMPLPSNGTTFSINSNIMKITIKSPTPGHWTLERTTQSSTWNVNVTAQSEIDFTSNLLETAEDGMSYQVYTNPVIGFNYTLAVDVQNLPENASIEKAFLLHNTWSVIEVLHLTKISSEGITRFSSAISIDRKINGVRIQGYDCAGNPITRITRFEIRPVGVKLRIIPSTSDFEVNKEGTVTYELTNTGDVEASFKVNISVDNGYLTSQNSINKHLQAGENAVESFHINATQSGSTVKVQIFVLLGNSPDVLQTARRRYFVSDVQRLQCLVTYKSSDCTVESLTTKTCADYNWNGTAEITFFLKKPTQITTSYSDIKVEHETITIANKNLSVNISGPCCVQSAQLIAYDNDGYAAKCEFMFSNGTIQAVEIQTTTVQIFKLTQVLVKMNVQFE
ncbi:von Willebrand factor A domain-containing protein 7-like [Saccostrea echinata]|uniref:von Willebrand factor A domain-containing protein 7-like n=1 Tax=Saccostrea echinata TaxID=191078 RepID=UPI002A7EADD3|nr:von Willebrand factor A domain-containing protein 7-like [Saccostrea echinata]